MGDTVAVDMFVVATATFRLLYTVIVLGHDRRRIIHFNVAQNPTQVWLAHQMTEAFPWDTAPQYLLQKVELHPLHQLPFRSDAVKRLQQHRPKQPLRRNRRPAKPGRIQCRQLSRQIDQGRVGDLPDDPQRMIRPNLRLKINLAEQRSRPFIRSAHHGTQVSSSIGESLSTASYDNFLLPCRAGATRTNWKSAAATTPSTVS
jgi:hypothetical protein